MDSAGGTCSGSLTCCKPKIVFTPTKTPTTKPTATPTSGGSGGGCVAAGGSYVHINRTGFSCDVCTFGGIMTCAGPSGGSGGDPCKKYINGVLTSVSCEEVGMIRCNCGGNAWTAGKKGVSCVQLCDCAGINCDQCTPTPTKPTTVTNTPTTVVTNTPTPTTVVTNTPTPTTVVTNTPTNTPVVNTPQPGQCDASCGNDSDCESGLSCVVTGGIHRCRKNACPDEATCSCPAATPTTRTYVDNTPTTRTYVNNNTPTPTRVRLIAEVPTATPTEQPTPKIPVAGVGPGVFGAISVAGSILLLLIGLAL